MTSEITVRGARLHNLKNVTVSIPKNQLVILTGLSGSGKSTLGLDILFMEGQRQYLESLGFVNWGVTKPPVDGISGLSPTISIDQHLTNRSPRSTVGTGGRCERCQGAGVLTVKMHFMPDVEVRCPACHGRRFTRETLTVRYRDHDISQVLDMTVEEALSLFQDVLAARSRLQVLSEVGLGYLQLGQPATRLSGGEAQRVKLAKELGRRVTGRTLYLLDEPTTGLHLADTARLLGVLQRLVEAGNSVIVVEHNLELIKAVDWVIDLGPEGGAEGGRLIAEGTPEQIAQAAGSYTGQCLRQSIGT